jgi:hypothetical protein
VHLYTQSIHTQWGEQAQFEIVSDSTRIGSIFLHLLFLLAHFMLFLDVLAYCCYVRDEYAMGSSRNFLGSIHMFCVSLLKHIRWWTSLPPPFQLHQCEDILIISDIHTWVNFSIALSVFSQWERKFRWKSIKRKLPLLWVCVGIFHTD